MTTDVLDKPDIADQDTTEHGKVSHIIRKSDQMRGYVLGDMIPTLCGRLIPCTRAPDGLPVCDRCKEVLGELQRMQ